MSPPAFTVDAYQVFLAQHKLMASRCLDCGKLYLPPRGFCGASRSRSMKWTELSGIGTVVALTDIRVVDSAMAAIGYGADRPYCSGFVALKEGLTIPTRFENSDGSLRVGARVLAHYIDEPSGCKSHVTLVFHPA